MRYEMTEEQLNALLDAAYLCWYKRSDSPLDLWRELQAEKPSSVGEDVLRGIFYWAEQTEENEQ